MPPVAPVPANAAPCPAPADECALLRARLAELERHVDEIQAIAALGSYQWFVAEDRIAWSAEQLRIHGLDAASHPRTLADFLACIHPDDRARQAEAMTALMRDGRAESRYRIVRPDGAVRTVHARGSVVCDAAGVPVRVVGTVQDVTAAVASEAELRAANERLEQRVAERTAALGRSEEHFRRLIEHAHDLIVIVDGAGMAHYGSPSVQRVLGVDPETINGHSILPLVHPDDRARTAAWLAGLAAAEAGTRQTCEYRFRHAAGHWVWLESACTPEPGDGLAAGHVINIRDVTERRQAEAALRDSEARQRTLIAQLPAIIYTASLEPGHPTTFVSPQAERLLGISEAEWLAEPRLWLERIHPDDRAGVEAEWHAAHAAGRRYAGEYRMVTRDGRVRWFRDEATVIRDGAGHPCCIQGVMLDVTERREAEAALRRAEERWRAMLDNAHDVVTILDPEGRMGYQSPALTRVLGYTAEELAGQVAFDYMHPDDVPAVVAQFGQVLADPGSVGHAEYRFRHKDGSWRDLEAFGRTLSPVSPQEGLVANVRDVTERRAAEHALREREAHFRALIENGNDLVMISAPDLALTYVSPSFERLVGYTPEEMLGVRPDDVLHPDDLPIVYESMQAIFAVPGTMRRLKWRFRHKDGSWRLFDAIGRTIDPHSAERGAVCNGRDITEQHEAERALQRSEEHFRRLIEHSYDLVQVLDPSGRVVYTGPSVQRLLGYTPEEVSGGTLDDFMHPDDLPAAAALVQHVLANPGKSGSLEYRVRHKDGSWRWFEAYARTLSATTANEGIVANARDITERREAERALRESEEHFRTLIENGSDLLMICGADLRLSYVSPSVERLLGYTPEEMLERRPEDMLHPDDVTAVHLGTRECLATPGTVRRFAYRIRHRDGSWRLLDAIGRTIDPQSPDQGVVCNARDITEQHETELALQRSEEHFRRLIENGSDLLLISAPDGALTYVSPSAQRLLGYAPEEMLGLTPENAPVHPDDVERVRDSLRQVGERPGTVLRVTWRIHHRDGSWRVFEALARTFAPDSADAGFVINGRDVTEQRAQEAELRQANAEAERAREDAERANRAKSEFLSRMSHELRTPLNSILGFAQVLEDLELPPEYRGGVRHILNGGRHLLDLINEVLDIARIEADQQQLSIEPVRVGAVIHEAVDMVRPLATAREIWVGVIPHPAESRYVRADRQRLTQVLLNLLSNAVKYNRAAGAVRIGVEPVDGGARLRIRVTDEGPGIPADRHEELFVPFARLGAEHTGVEGTGLGLALSERLARAMGGILQLERTGPEGSTFAVDLAPAEDPVAAARALSIVAPSPAPADGPGRVAATLLYIEDNLANLSLVETILRPHPAWRLIPALQGGLGLELAAEHAPDLVLLDLHLPDMPGREVLRRLRADPRTAHLPVVVISADATPRTVDELRAAGAEAFLTKPLDVRAFVATVERLLAARRVGRG